jgi:hypothetical protein
VIASVPEAWVQHDGFAVEVPFVLGELVNQDDRVRTSKQGRIRIQLLDGSSLALGSRTAIEITVHDPGTQHTQIEVKGGTLLADVTRPPKAGSSFLVRTPAALIRVAQGTVVVDSRARWSDVCVLTGSATVRGSIGSPAGDVAPHPNECTRVTMNEPPADPAPGAGLISSLRKQTDFQPNTEAEVTAPTIMGPALGPPPAGIAVKAAAAVSTGAAVLSAISLVLNADAQSSLQSATQHLKGAANAASQAAAGAQAAEASATNASNTAAQLLQSFNAFFGLVAPLVSPSAP